MTRPSSDYLPTLDGWRAISILAVIFHHSFILSVGPLNTRWLHDYGYLGVDVFFAISGILICQRLLVEEKKFGSISLKNFYIRRAFRILPPAMAYLITLLILGAKSLVVVYPRPWVAALFFFRNYPSLSGHLASTADWYTAHFWSLSIEEHFYLLLPAILVLTRPRGRLISLCSLAGLIALRCFLQLRHQEWGLIEHHTDVRLNSLILPAIISVLIARGRDFQKYWRFWPLNFAILAGLIATLKIDAYSFWQVMSLSLLMPCIVIGTVLNPGSWLGRFLELNALRYIGRISYSLYLWQQLFFTREWVLGTNPLHSIQQWPINLALTFACAITSHHLLETPLIRIGHRLAKRQKLYV